MDSYVLIPICREPPLLLLVPFRLSPTPIFPNGRNNREPKPFPRFLEAIPEYSPNSLEHIQVVEAVDSTEVLAVDSKPLEVAGMDG